MARDLRVGGQVLVGRRGHRVVAEDPDVGGRQAGDAEVLDQRQRPHAAADRDHLRVLDGDAGPHEVVVGPHGPGEQLVGEVPARAVRHPPPILRHAPRRALLRCRTGRGAASSKRFRARTTGPTVDPAPGRRPNPSGPAARCRSGHVPAARDDPRPDLCIIGAGPAGLAVATRAASRGLSVLLAESGGRVEGPRDDLNQGRITEAHRADDRTDPELTGGMSLYGGSYLAESRWRGLGGSAHRWGVRGFPGDDLRLRIVRADREDFTAHPAFGIDEWPVPWPEMDRRYEEAMAFLGPRRPLLRRRGLGRRHGALPARSVRVEPARLPLPPGGRHPPGPGGRRPPTRGDRVADRLDRGRLRDGPGPCRRRPLRDRRRRDPHGSPGRRRRGRRRGSPTAGSCSRRSPTAR